MENYRDEILRVENIVAGYGNMPIVRDISFNLKKGEILGIVGESGCGKSTLIKAVSRINGLNTDILGGKIFFEGQDLTKISNEDKRRLLGNDISMIFQNPEASLNHSRKIGIQFTETIRSHRDMSKEEIRCRIGEIFESIGLTDVDRILNSYPFELSGGMAQRVAIALAMVLKPKLILADEPTSALDTTIQKQVIDELLALREKFNTTMVVITHNIGVVSKLANYTGVMYGGRLVEYGETEKVLKEPIHPYTKALLGAVPKLGGELPVGLAGRPPKFHELKDGCAFCKRCAYAKEECECFDNKVTQVESNHRVICLREA